MLHKIIVTDRFIPKRFDAYTIGPLVLLRPNKRDDQGLIAHELEHVKQWWHNPLMGLWYQFSKKSRYQYELAAYRAQLKISAGRDVHIFAGYLASNYNLDVTVEQARRDLLA